MSIFGSIVSKIFHHGGDAPAAQPAATDAPATQTAASDGPAAATPAPDASPSPTPSAAPSGTPSASGAPSSPATPAPTGGQTVDVEQVMNGLAAKNSQKLDWRHSIVDMMKLLDLDSSLSARKELAQELHYTGDMSDSASMNVWLHAQVMRKLAENGGNVPDDLKA